MPGCCVMRCMAEASDLWVEQIGDRRIEWMVCARHGQLLREGAPFRSYSDGVMHASTLLMGDDLTQ